MALRAAATRTTKIPAHRTVGDGKHCTAVRICEASEQPERLYAEHDLRCPLSMQRLENQPELGDAAFEDGCRIEGHLLH